MHWNVKTEASHWPVPVDASATYRLVVAGGQLVGAGNSVGLAHIATVGRNATLSRMVHHPAYQEPLEAGPGVRLADPVAIHIQGKGYLVFNTAVKRLRWQKEDRFSALNVPDVYQWQFRSPPGSNVRDHRDRVIRTQEALGLYNAVKKDYLVYGADARRLRWMQQ
jgi:hypothetical protein